MMMNAPNRATTIRIGEFEIISVWDGTLDAKVDTIRNLPPDEVERRLLAAREATGVDPLVLPVRAFVVRGAGRIVLIDTGSGTTKGSSMGHLPASLAAIGIPPSAVDHILLTHLHMDHIGGMVTDEHRPAFSNAEIVLHRTEAEFFLDSTVDSLDPRSARHIAFQRSAIAAYGQCMRRVDDGEVLPGISARLAPGHTPGHTAWRIASGNDVALVIGDVVHLAAIQLPLPDTPMIYDVDPLRAAKTRLAMLNEVSGQSTWVVGAHLPAGGLGRIVRQASGFAFEPAA